MTDLKPCPFCGGEPSGFPKDGPPETVNCLSCLIRSYVLFGFECGEQHGLAPDDWNTRATDWRDISTAPRDGRRIIASTASYTEPLILYWCKHNGQEAWWDWDLDSYTDVTHWQPLPDPPEAA